jgi:hypothetical protein
MIYPVTMADLIVEQDPDPEASLNGESPGAERRRLLTKKSEGKPSPVKASLNSDVRLRNRVGSPSPERRPNVCFLYLL